MSVYVPDPIGATYATSAVRFHLTRALDEPSYQALMDVPGVVPWLKGRRLVQAPVSVAHVVEEELARLGVGVRKVDVPPAMSMPEVSPTMILACRDLAVAGGLHAWSWDNFAHGFQVTATTWATIHQRSAVWAEPGAGKTWIAVAFACSCRQPAMVAVVLVRVLVITVSSAVRQTVAEWRRFTRRQVCAVLSPSSRRKKDPDPRDVLRDPAGVVVIGWDLITSAWSWLEELLGSGFVCIFDEADYAKNGKRVKWGVGADGKPMPHPIESRSSTAYKIALRAGHVLCTTGTAVAEAIPDIYGQMTLVEPYAWGQTPSRFLKRYCDAAPGVYGGLVVPKGASSPYLPELRSRLAWSALQIPYEVSHGHLPEKRRMLLRVGIDEQIAERSSYAAQARKATTDEDRTFWLLACAAVRKRPFLVSQVAGWSRLGKGKVVVFTGLRRDADGLAEALVKKGHVAWASHGEHSAEEREDLRLAYMAHPGPCVLCVTWQAWGTGVNLDDTDVIAAMMLPFRPRDISQLEGRGDRLSMTRALLYVYLVAEGTIDEHVADLVLEKLAAVREVTPGGRLDAVMGGGGGVREVLTGADDVSDLQAEMLRRLRDDVYAVED